MRISDWSSDVCSSDLASDLGPVWQALLGSPPGLHLLVVALGVDPFLGDGRRLVARPGAVELAGLETGVIVADAPLAAIGAAGAIGGPARARPPFPDLRYRLDIAAAPLC